MSVNPPDLFRHRQLKSLTLGATVNRRGDEGSISILIISLFLFTTVLTLVAIDVAGAFRAKRELVNISEAAVASAAHNLDADRYYEGSWKNQGHSVGGRVVTRVPINCAQALTSLQSNLASSQLEGSPLILDDFSCSQDILRATISSNISPVLTLRLGNRRPIAGPFNLRATVSASSILR